MARGKTIKFHFPQPVRSGLRVITLKDVDHAYGDLIVYRGLQFHAEPQPVDEDAGDMRPLLLARGLPLDDRGEDQGLLRAGQRQVLAALAPQLVELMGHRAAHPLDQLLAGLAIAVDVGVR